MAETEWWTPPPPANAYATGHVSLILVQAELARDPVSCVRGRPSRKSGYLPRRPYYELVIPRSRRSSHSSRSSRRLVVLVVVVVAAVTRPSDTDGSSPPIQGNYRAVTKPNTQYPPDSVCIHRLMPDEQKLCPFLSIRKNACSAFPCPGQSQIST